MEEGGARREDSYQQLPGECRLQAMKEARGSEHCLQGK